MSYKVYLDLKDQVITELAALARMHYMTYFRAVWWRMFLFLPIGIILLLSGGILMLDYIAKAKGRSCYCSGGILVVEE